MPTRPGTDNQISLLFARVIIDHYRQRAADLYIIKINKSTDILLIGMWALSFAVVL